MYCVQNAKKSLKLLYSKEDKMYDYDDEKRK
jgi:hypothetical protein